MNGDSFNNNVLYDAFQNVQGVKRVDVLCTFLAVQRKGHIGYGEIASTGWGATAPKALFFKDRSPVRRMADWSLSEDFRDL